MINSVISYDNLRHFIVQNAAYYAMICIKSFYALLSTTPAFLITPQATPSICMANHSPPSSGNHRSLFVKPAKRGKQRAGGEALFVLHHFTFNYPQHHHLQLTPKQPPPFAWLTTPLSLRRGAGVSALSPSLHPLTPQKSGPTATCFEPWDNVFRTEKRGYLRVNDEEDGAWEEGNEG